jgi:hypothetical protein
MEKRFSCPAAIQNGQRYPTTRKCRELQERRQSVARVFLYPCRLPRGWLLTGSEGSGNFAHKATAKPPMIKSARATECLALEEE